MKNRRTPAAAAAMLVIIGLIGFTNLTRNPRFQLFHTVDVLQLLATGICFGVALATIVGTLRRRA